MGGGTNFIENATLSLYFQQFALVPERTSLQAGTHPQRSELWYLGTTKPTLSPISQMRQLEGQESWLPQGDGMS